MCVCVRVCVRACVRPRTCVCVCVSKTMVRDTVMRGSKRVCDGRYFTVT